MPGHHSPSRTRKASETRKSNNRKKVAGTYVGGLEHLTNPEPPHEQTVEGQGEPVASITAPSELPVADPVQPDTPTTLGHFPVIDLTAPPTEVEQVEAERKMAENNAPSKLTKAERRTAALNLRTAGHSFRVIAEELGVSVKTAYHDVADALSYLSKYERVLAEDHRAMQLTRLDAMLSYIWGRVENGDTFACGTALTIMARQSKLLGLDAPIEIDVNVRRPLKEATITDLMELAKRLASVRSIPGSVIPGAPTIDLPGTIVPQWDERPDADDETDEGDTDATD